MARLLTDENVPSSVSDWLRARGHDVRRVAEVIHSGASDDLVARNARKAGRTVVTLDQDFIGLYYQRPTPPGVIVIRTHPPTPARIKVLLELLFATVDMARHQGELIVITDTEIRIEGSES